MNLGSSDSTQGYCHLSDETTNLRILTSNLSGTITNSQLGTIVMVQ